MMNERAKEIQQLIFDHFPIDKPEELTNIGLIGCCEEHDDWYAPYRSLSWPEFGKEILADELNERLDAIDFNTIQISAFHYFVPGILWAVTESIILHQEVAGCLCHWVNTIENSKRKVDPFLKKRVDRFTDEQKRLVFQCLVLAHDMVEMMGGYWYEINRATVELWSV